jgi:hypothetical protein
VVAGLKSGWLACVASAPLILKNTQPIFSLEIVNEQQSEKVSATPAVTIFIRSVTISTTFALFIDEKQITTSEEHFES